jgi:hypothetical protein
MPSVEEQADTLDLINTELSGRLTRQAASGSQVDTKAALLAGVAAAATQFLATRKDPDLFFAVPAYMAYAGALLAAVAAYALARYEDVPDPRGLVRLCVDRTKVETLAHLVAARVEVYEANCKKHRRKVLLWWASVVALVLGLALAAASVVYTDHRDGPHAGDAPGPGVCAPGPTGVCAAGVGSDAGRRRLHRPLL